ncbi:type II toxin-antitoxin system Phd/YefM family antitoxin [Vreelandella alkaliphila]|uniref:Prevent-host-death protein n=1 Tax=Vreelandella alkaliphila TaxID=272774 RepID=A0AAJ2VM53_9GAMM|nr:hypothetical protein [Halomonas alkaliphila]MDX5976152.1 hypothetical protein [Halomonas alkaliphila]
MIISVQTAEKQLHSLIEKALAGEEINITLDGKSYVQLVPFKVIDGAKQLYGCMKGEIDYVEGWDAPLDGMNN